ncbi:hypothetical protein DFJ58DRAFT_269659 [Suillus subalutaceus]|uniref:uncharacterized protein n=1 Tax=Suillus subalutaceus TaxID=48586 RepID=UPI001B865EF8|nr:uncharacterized protein DFJ58DRAFT_269659 [Suillus subalutaceus]KAG1860658.1 hypothetical protein DFJ58DRAFT_269659 [Suillus subalutaceus]
MMILMVPITGLGSHRRPHTSFLTFPSLCRLSPDQSFVDVLRASFLLFPPLSKQPHSRSLQFFVDFSAWSCVSFPIQPQSRSLQFFCRLLHILLFFTFPSPDPINTVFHRFLHTHLLLALSFFSFPIPLQSRSAQSFTDVLHVFFLPFLFPYPSVPIISLSTQRRPSTFSICLSSPLLPHTALTFNSAPNLHFADRRRCHDDTNTTRYPLVGACISRKFPNRVY